MLSVPTGQLAQTSAHIPRFVGAPIHRKPQPVVQAPQLDDLYSILGMKAPLLFLFYDNYVSDQVWKRRSAAGVL
jgi:hypothetical protein